MYMFMDYKYFICLICKKEIYNKHEYVIVDSQYRICHQCQEESRLRRMKRSWGAIQENNVR